MHYIPGLTLRVSEEDEILGIDDTEMGELAYDYVGLEQEIGHPLKMGIGASGGGREPDHHGETTSGYEKQSRASS
jgi:Amt family ammonium transporter